MTDHIMQGEDNSDLFAELFADEDKQESNKLVIKQDIENETD